MGYRSENEIETRGSPSTPPGAKKVVSTVRTATAITLLLLTGPASPALGQVLRGRLLDLDTDEPIARGVLTLMREDGVRVQVVTTDSDGRYRLVAPEPGSYLLEARRLGYRPWLDGPIELAAGDEWETEYHLQALPIQLDPVEVTAEAEQREAFLHHVGFYERQKADFGHFVTRDDIEHRAPTRMTDLLNGIPGVRLVPSASGLSRASIAFRGSRLSQGGLCHPRVFVDDIIVIRGDARARGTDVQGFPESATEMNRDPAERPEIALDDVVQPEDVEAIEVYRRGVEVPVRFGGTSTQTQCGVIVIWTRSGRPRPQ